MKIIKQLFEKWACKHKWETYYRSEIFGTSARTGWRSENPIRIDDTLICQICGKIKKISV